MVGARQQGSVLISAILALVIVAAASYGLNLQLGEMASRLTAENEKAAAEYLAEAGLKHALLAARRSGDTYPSTVSGDLVDQGRYDVNLVQSSNSFTATSTGTTKSGAVARFVRTYYVCTQSTAKMLYIGGGEPVIIHEEKSSPGQDFLTVENKPAVRARTVMKFDLPIAKGNMILSAQLSLDTQSEDMATYNSSLYVDRLTTAFDSGGVSWANASAGKKWQTAGGDFSLVNEARTTILPGVVTYNWDVKDMVNDWVNNGFQNHGLIIRTDAVSTDKYGLKFRAKMGQNPESVWPRLVVTWCG